MDEDPCKVRKQEAKHHARISAHDQPAVALYVPQLLLQLGILLLFLQQSPLYCSKLLLGLTLDVIGYHHRSLQVGLKPPPLLSLLLRIAKSQ